MMSDDVGGYGNRESNSIWFRYRAYREDGGQKVPVGKLTKWNKDAQREDDYSFVSGLLQSVQFRLNEGNPSKGVEEYNEMVVVLTQVKAGESFALKVALRASSTAAFAVARRLPGVTRGEHVVLKAFVMTTEGHKSPGLTLMKVVGGQEMRIEPVDSGVEFVRYDGLKGPKLDIAKNSNAMLREEWIEDTVKRLPYYDDGSAQSVAAVAEKPVEGGEYDPFALE
jgi:hypothetical protein